MSHLAVGTMYKVVDSANYDWLARHEYVYRKLIHSLLKLMSPDNEPHTAASNGICC
jgi:hypothetical protein